MARSAIPPLSTPSYASGFARHAGESVCPSLWQGLKGLWCPFLGPASLDGIKDVVLDWSGYGQYGAVTANIVNTVVDGIPCVNMNSGNEGNGASSQRVTMTSRDHFSGYTTGLTMLTYARNHKADIAGTGSEYLFNKLGSGADSYWLYWADGEDVVAMVETSSAVSATYTDGIASAQGRPGDEWHLIVATYDLANIRVYVDGIMGGSAAQTGSVNSTAHLLRLGRGGSQGWDGHGAIWALWDRALRHEELQRFNADPFILLRRRRRATTRLAVVSGPFRVIASEVFTAGATEAEVFTAGAVEGEVAI